MYYYLSLFFPYFIITGVNLTFFCDLDLRFQYSRFLYLVNEVATLSQSVMSPLLA